MPRSSTKTKTASPETNGKGIGTDWSVARDILRQSVSLVRVLERLGVALDQSGTDHLKGLCPLHDEKSPSFYVNQIKDLFFCHGCDTGGDLFKFIQLRENVSHVGAITWLSQTFSIDLSSARRALTADEIKKHHYLEVNRAALRWWGSQSQSHLTKWLKKRGIADSVVSKYELVYSANAPTAKELGTDDETMTALGFDRVRIFHHAIVVPLMSVNGEIVGFRVRPLEPGQLKVIGPHASHPLPLPPLYGLPQALSSIRNCDGRLVIVEGEPDCWSVAQGWNATVAGMGTKLPDDFLATLKGYGIKEVVLMPDGDKGGQEFALRTAEKSGRFTFPVRMATMPTDLDPDELVVASGVKAAVKLIKESTYLSEWAVKTAREGRPLKSTTDKLDYLADIVEYVRGARDVEAELIIKSLADEFGLEYHVIDELFKSAPTDQTALDSSAIGERALLSACLRDEMARHTIMTHIQKTTFHLKRHTDLFGVIVQMEHDRIIVAPDTVKAELDKIGLPSLKMLVDDLLTVDIGTYEYHMKEVRDKAVRREALSRIDAMKSDLFRPNAPARQTLERGVSDLAQMTIHTNVRIQQSGPLVDRTMNEIAERMRSPNMIIGWDIGNHWPLLNRVLLGVQQPRYFVMAAPSGVGKTAFACNMANVIAGDLRVATTWFTFEMPPEALQYRMLSIQSGVEEESIKGGMLNSDQMKKVKEAAVRLHGCPIYWSRDGRRVEALESIVRSHVLKYGVKFIVIDYIQLMETDESGSGTERLGYISGRIQDLTNELGITSLTLCQINREGAQAVMARDTHIGGAYKIIQDADHALIVAERDPSEVAEDKLSGNLRALLDKNRYGRSDVQFNIIYEKETLRMKEAKVS